MLATLTYLGAAVLTILVLTWFTPSGTSVIELVVTTIALVAVLVAARHGPAAMVDILDAVARLLGR